MLCDRCKKNEATVHIHEIHNGKTRKLNLCVRCAAELNFGPEMPRDLAEILKKIQNLERQVGSPNGASPSAPDAAQARNTKACPYCGFSVNANGARVSEVGCPHCYVEFADILRPQLNLMQADLLHVGKKPLEIEGDRSSLLRYKLLRLEYRLLDLAKREKYEDAAVVRDEIATIKCELASLEQEQQDK